MKKILFILAALVMSVGSVWAQGTTWSFTLDANQGKYYRGTSEWTAAWCNNWKSNDLTVAGTETLKVILDTDGTNNMYYAGATNGDKSLDNSIFRVAPGQTVKPLVIKLSNNEYIIKSITFTVGKSNNATATNVTLPNGQTIERKTNSEDVTVTDHPVNDATVSFTFSGQNSWVEFKNITVTVAKSTTITLWKKPAFGGTVWTYNASTNLFEANGQNPTAAPGRANNMGPVYTFDGVGTVTTQVNRDTDTSDKGGFRVLGNGDNVTSNIGRWAGSIEVEEFAVASINYSTSLKGTEPETSATVWTNGELSITGRTTFDMNDGNAQRWYIGERGCIKTGFTSVSKGGRAWNFQVVVADEAKIAGVSQTKQAITKKVMTWGANLSAQINSIKAYYKDAEGNLTELPSTAISYDNTGISITYEGLANDKVSFTYVYKYNDVVKHSETISQSVGSTFPEATVWSAIPFGLTTAGAPTGAISASAAGQEYVITLSSALPFEFYDNYQSVTKWYALQGQSNNHHWLYSEDGSLVVGEQNAARGVTSSYAWAFIGNPFDGFKIVNKKATEANNGTLTMISDADPCTLTTEENVVTMAASRVETLQNGYFCFYKTAPNYYNVNTNNRNLSRWTDNDAGSTFKVEEFVPDDRTKCTLTINYTAGENSWSSTIEKYAAEEITTEDVAVDFYKNFAFAAGTDVVVSESNNTFSVTCEPNFPFIEGLPYRIQSRGDDHQEMDFFDGGDNPKYGNYSNDDKKNYWVFTHVANTQDQFTVKNVASGKYLTLQDGTRKIAVMGNEPYALRVRKSTNNRANGYAAFCLQNTDEVRCCVGPHIGENEAVGGWAAGSEADALGNDQNCLIVIATVVPVEFKEAGLGYSTLFSEHALEIADDVTAYYVTYNSETGNLTAHEIENVIPANTGVVLHYGEAISGVETVNFAVTSETASTDVQSNILTGTLTEVARVENSYVFSVVGGQPGFYKFGGDKLAANKAYYVPTEEQQVQGFVIDFGGVTTAINAIQQAKSQKASFDLQGRRINKATRGLFIQNGQKVIR